MNKWFVDAKETVRVNLEDEQWIDIKTSISSSEQDFLARETTDVQFDVGQDEEGDVTTNTRSQRRRRQRNAKRFKQAKMIPGLTPLLKVIIVAWSFVDESGFPIPVTMENIGNLRREVGNKVQDAWLEIDPLEEED